MYSIELYSIIPFLARYNIKIVNYHIIIDKTFNTYNLGFYINNKKVKIIYYMKHVVTNHIYFGLSEHMAIKFADNYGDLNNTKIY